jgi:hydroxyacylglutathione hydrolase
MLPAHGAVIDDPAPLLHRYLAHRREREEQVLDALGRGDSTADAIVARLYRELPQTVVPRAVETIAAHLRKLEQEGRARMSDGAWHIIEP